MVKVHTYNKKGDKAGEIELKDKVFGLEPKEALVHQAYVSQRSQAREPWAHAKDRSEVRGGGRKPWRQKGTGRARHGSIRSPIWTGGGVTFGPRKNRNFSKNINKKMKKRATQMCLADKVRTGRMIVLEDVEETGKTKDLVKTLSKLPSYGKSTIFLLPEVNKKIMLSLRNVENVSVQQASDVNIVDLLSNQFVIVTKKSVEVLEKRFS